MAALPQGKIAVCLLELHGAGPELARGFLGVDHRAATEKHLGKLLLERLERFREAARTGDEASLGEWVDYDLVAVLDGLAQLLSTAIEERRNGRGAPQRVEAELQRWLYERLAPICRDQGWFEVEPILPYATAFNPRIHNSVGSRSVEGAENLVVEIRSIGRRDPHTREIVRLAEVVVGC